MRGMMVIRAGALLLSGYAFAAGSGGPAVSSAGGSRGAGPRVGEGCPAGGTAEPHPLAFPPLTGRIVDRAGLLARPEEAELEGLLARHERATTNQVVVVTLETL